MKRQKHTFTRDELIREVKRETPIGEKLAEMTIKYLKSFVKERDEE